MTPLGNSVVSPHPGRRFPRDITDLLSNVVSLSIAVSFRGADVLVQATEAVRNQIRILQSSPYLDLIERITGPRWFAYISEAVFSGILGFKFVMLCAIRRGVPYKDFELLRNNRFYVETLEKNIPHVLRWYRAISRFDLKGDMMQYRDSFRSSPSIFAVTPDEAARRHTEEVTRGGWTHPPLEGKVRLCFFKDYHGERDSAQDILLQRPDVRMDLHFDPSRGVNLGNARKLLGVEKLSVLTGLSNRMSFDPVDTDRLSPVAAYDLSKQFREPIRVFEPCPSMFTKIKRRIHDTVYLSTYLVVTVLRICVGSTLHNRHYLTASFGEKISGRCIQLSQSIRPLRLWVREGCVLLGQICACFVLLPIAVLLKAVVYFERFLIFLARKSLALPNMVRYMLYSLSLKTWTTIVIIAWIVFADLSQD